MTHNGGQPHHVGDTGQRYEVTFLDADGKRLICGWSNTWEGALTMSRALELHPVWNTPEIKDRHDIAAPADAPRKAM